MPDRDCHRLLAVIRAKGSAESLELCELLKLSEWITHPPAEYSARKWAETIGLPVLKDLSRRLANETQSREVDLPEFFALLTEMRKAQRAFFAARRKARDVREPLLKEAIRLERQVDRVLSEHYQPTLFG